MAKNENHHPIDVHVGRRLRDRRVLMGLTQPALGEAVDLTFQQIQKYERGATRISASRLYQFASILDVDIDYFFDGMAEDDLEVLPIGHGEPGRMREALALVRAYYLIEDEGVRRSVFELTKAIADE